MRFREYLETSQGFDSDRTTLHAPAQTGSATPAQTQRRVNQASTGNQQQVEPDPQVAEYERQSRMIGRLPAGWDSWTDMQKIIHVTHQNGLRRMTTQRPQRDSSTNSTPQTPAPQPTQTAQAGGWWSRLFGGS